MVKIKSIWQMALLADRREEPHSENGMAAINPANI